LPPEAEALLVFGCSMEAANLSTFLILGNRKKSDICVSFTKIMCGYETGESAAKLGSLCPHPGPGLKQPLVAGY